MLKNFVVVFFSRWSNVYFSANHENAEKLAAMIYAPYKCYVAKYESYEEGALTAELNSIRLARNLILLLRALFVCSHITQNFIQNVTEINLAITDVMCNVTRTWKCCLLQDHAEIMDTVRLLANSVSKLFVAANKVRIYIA